MYRRDGSSIAVICQGNDVNRVLFMKLTLVLRYRSAASFQATSPCNCREETGKNPDKTYLDRPRYSQQAAEAY